MDALLPVKREAGGGGATYRWQGSVKYSLLAMARGTFASPILSGEALFDCICDLQLRSGLPHSRLARHTSHGLTLFFDDLMSRADSQAFFISTLPQIARLALDLPSLLQSQSQHLAELGAKDRPEMVLRLLRKQQAGMVLLRQELVASLLACSFLCLFPSENRCEEDLGSINFDRLFAGVYERGESNENKLQCIIHYFDRVCNTMPHGSVSFERKVLPKKEVHDAIWTSSQAPLCPITLLEKGFIEDGGRDCLQVDFANRLLGGGALAGGCVQEEIRFMINPELIAGMLFMPAMADNESIEMVGAERYSSYEGYGATFRFKGDFQDSTPRDTWGRRQTCIIAIDALPLPGEKQFHSPLMLRELMKAYCGFLDTCSTVGEAGATRGDCAGWSGISQRQKNCGDLGQTIFEAGVSVAVETSLSDVESKMLTSAANESSKSLEPECTSQHVDVMDVMAESDCYGGEGQLAEAKPVLEGDRCMNSNQSALSKVTERADLQDSALCVDAIDMITETESHGGGEQRLEDNTLVIDIHHGTDEHAMDLGNGGDAMDIADDSPHCVKNKQLSDGVVLGITTNVSDTGATTNIKPIVGIATGNWGCGAFGGNLELKSLLQWLAASQAGRPYMLYFSFRDPRAKRFQEVADWILQEQWCVGELWSILLEYGGQGQFHVNLFDWIMPQPGTNLCSSQHYHKAG